VFDKRTRGPAISNLDIPRHRSILKTKELLIQTTMGFFNFGSNSSKPAKIAVYADPAITEKAIDLLKEFFGKKINVSSTFNKRTKFKAFFLAPYTFLYSGGTMEKVRGSAAENCKIVAISLSGLLIDKVKAENENNNTIILPDSLSMLTREQTAFLNQTIS